VVTLGRDLNLGIFAKWMELVGGEIGWSRNKSESNSYTFKTLTRHIFTPNLAYAKLACEDPSVVEYIKSSGFRTNLYMVTGILIAKEASHETSSESQTGGTLDFG